MSAFIDEKRASFGVKLICASIDVSASAYYQRSTGERCARVVEDERLLAVIRTTHKANYEAYGSRRMWKALRRQGETAPRCQVERLMAANAICGAKRRCRPWRTTIPGPERAQSPDLLNRDFTALAPNRCWVADFTYIRCWEGVVFFSFVLDVYSRMIVGWQFAGHMRTSLVGDALQMAVSARQPDQDGLLIHHSDRGSQPRLNRSSQQWVSAEPTGRRRRPGYQRPCSSLRTPGRGHAAADDDRAISGRVLRCGPPAEDTRLHSSLDDVPPAEFEAHQRISDHL